MFIKNEFYDEIDLLYMFVRICRFVSKARLFEGQYDKNYNNHGGCYVSGAAGKRFLPALRLIQFLYGGKIWDAQFLPRQVGGTVSKITGGNDQESK